MLAAAAVAAVLAATAHTVVPTANTVSEPTVTPPALVDGAPVAGKVSGAIPKPHARSRGTAAGYSLHVPNTIGVTPKGLTFYVDKRANHHASLATHTRGGVASLRSAGLKATYGGYGTPAADEGIVTVTEGMEACDGAYVGTTWPRLRKLPNGKLYTSSAKIIVCPELWTYDPWQWSALIRHEVGHAAGLGHFDGVYAKTTQVMRSRNMPPVATFKAGDLNGLRFLASNNANVKELMPSVGRFEDSTYEEGDVKIVGWALLEYYKAKKVTIQLTDNDKRIATVTTDVVRPDINKNYDPGTQRPHGFELSIPWEGGTHKYCLTAVSPVKSKNRVSLGCSTWS